MAARIQRRLGRTCSLLASSVIKGVARLKNRTLVNLVEHAGREGRRVTLHGVEKQAETGRM